MEDLQDAPQPLSTFESKESQVLQGEAQEIFDRLNATGPFKKTSSLNLAKEEQVNSVIQFVDHDVNEPLELVVERLYRYALKAYENELISDKTTDLRGIQLLDNHRCLLLGVQKTSKHEDYSVQQLRQAIEN